MSVFARRFLVLIFSAVTEPVLSSFDREALTIDRGGSQRDSEPPIDPHLSPPPRQIGGGILSSGSPPGQLGEEFLTSGSFPSELEEEG